MTKTTQITSVNANVSKILQLHRGSTKLMNLRQHSRVAKKEEDLFKKVASTAEEDGLVSRELIWALHVHENERRDRLGEWLVGDLFSCCC